MRPDRTLRVQNRPEAIFDGFVLAAGLQIEKDRYFSQVLSPLPPIYVIIMLLGGWDLGLLGECLRPSERRWRRVEWAVRPLRSSASIFR
jgi:hypothetical protein